MITLLFISVSGVCLYFLLKPPAAVDSELFFTADSLAEIHSYSPELLISAAPGQQICEKPTVL